MKKNVKKKDRIWVRLGSVYSIKEIQQPNTAYSKICVKRPLSKRPQICFQYQLSLNAGQNYCRMLQWEHSAILSTFIELPFVIKIFVLSIFEWPFYIDFPVCREVYMKQPELLLG